MYTDLLELLPADRWRQNEPMSKHTTFRIGGPADIMACPQNTEEIIRVLNFCRDKPIPFLVMGLGSNLLVKDKGFRGVVIKLSPGISHCEVLPGQGLEAQAGAVLGELCQAAADNGLSGLEFAEGIPGSLGGAIFMNAGAYGGEMKDVILDVTVIDQKGGTKVLSVEQLELGYRRSILQDSRESVISARLKLKPGTMLEIESKMRDFARQRKNKQPLDQPSAGSVFKRPPGHFVGPLLEGLGLKGHTVGGAQVSQMHAGFILNTGGAAAADVLNLIDYIQNRVWTEYQVELVPEITVVGE